MHGKRVLAAIEGSQFSALRRILEPRGYSVDLANTAASAEALVRSVHPDVLLVSVNLPDKGGIDVCRSMKADRKTAHIPVIFYSSFASTSPLTTQLAYAAGAYAFLTFGVSDQQLLSAIESSLEKHGGEELPEKRPA